MEMTITRALAELKLLDKRINRGINDSVLGGFTVGKKPMTGYTTVDDIESRVKSDFQSVNDLIKRRNQIKSAIVVSNATTIVEIASQKMTVAEAIERKSSIDYDKSLLNKLKNTYATLVNHVDRVNEEVKQRLDKHLETLFGKDGKVNAQANEDIVKSFKEQNEAKLIDPIGLKDKIDKLTKEIEAFEMEVDFILSESNTITRITIED
ncbi:hypothetical protein [Heyndrickxia camelliae]|uniref:Uncharacterized protein n=1 Tax=Heyndrickxia camelliae TaxID=1707093 RepID=A0A2N3LE65_9BACI|nr:hypothetical protein [Heyndrickxia camelliae]PKR82865.1 hypothetical protein CWO92_21995 [Heyndrickxia camelliae]